MPLDVDAFVFDIGETLVDETRTWESWADWLRIPRLTLLGMIGWGAGNDVQPREVVRMLRPGVDIRAEQCNRRAAGMSAVHIPRGPWGWAHSLRPDAERATLRVDSLLDLLQ